MCPRWWWSTMPPEEGPWWDEHDRSDDEEVASTLEWSGRLRVVWWGLVFTVLLLAVALVSTDDAEAGTHGCRTHVWQNVSVEVVSCR